ncbi:MAG: HAMP domain-containing protein [candidate division KSB1 bacterium]|nr:HAMP domain-containing protein [candidate division KSB1 bacterium]
MVAWFATMPIRLKMTLIITGIVFLAVVLLSVVLYHTGRTILLQRLQNTCNLLASNLSEYTREEMLLETAGAGTARDRVQDIVLRFKKLGIEGFQYAAVVARDGRIVAHTDYRLRGGMVSTEELAILAGLEGLYWRVVGDTTYQYFQPIFAVRRSGERTQRILLGAAVIGFSKAELWAPLRRARNILVVSLLVVFVFSPLVIYLVAERMTALIRQLSRAARAVGSGDLEVVVPVRRRDELGQLAADFNRMIRQLRERLHMQKFVSKLTVDMIRKRAAMGDPPETGGELRHCTVLFSDIRNFSAITAALPPEQVVSLINVYLDLQAQVIEQHRGVVDKFIGDQVMGIFLGEAMADHAIRAAVEIQRSIRTLNSRRLRKRQVALEVGIGINDGPAVVGNMGSSSRMDYTVIGDVVNVANRLCALAKPGQIITSANLVRSLTGSYPIVRLAPVMVKGKKEPVEVFEIDYDRAIVM